MDFSKKETHYLWYNMCAFYHIEFSELLLAILGISFMIYKNISTIIISFSIRLENFDNIIFNEISSSKHNQNR